MQDDPFHRTLYESTNLVQCMQALKRAVETTVSVGGGAGRGVDGLLAGLDGPTLRDALDRLFGEHDTAVQCLGIPNWVNACDYTPYGLYKQLSPSSPTSDKVELNRRISGVHLQDLSYAGELLNELLTPSALHQAKVPSSLYSLDAVRVYVRREVLPLATQRVLDACTSSGDCTQATRSDPLLRILAERHMARFKAPFLPAPPQQQQQQQRGYGRRGGGGDSGSSEEEAAAAAAGLSSAAIRAGAAFPVSASDAAMLYTLNYLSTPHQKWRHLPATTTASGLEVGDAEAMLCGEPMWGMRLGLDASRKQDPSRDALQVSLATGILVGPARGSKAGDSSSSSSGSVASRKPGSAVLPIVSDAVGHVWRLVPKPKKKSKQGMGALLSPILGFFSSPSGSASSSSSLQTADAEERTIYLSPPSLLTVRCLMDSLFWLGESFGTASPPQAALDDSSSSSSAAYTAIEDVSSPNSTHRLFVTAAARYLLLNNPLYLVPLPGMQAARQAGFLPLASASAAPPLASAFDRLLQPYHSSATPWDAFHSALSPAGGGGMAAAAAPAPAAAPRGYTPPRADTLQALAVLLTQLTCDKTFHLCIQGGIAAALGSGAQEPYQQGSSSSSSVTSSASVSTPLWVRAEEYARRAGGCSNSSGPLCNPRAWELWDVLEAAKRRCGPGSGPREWSSVLAIQRDYFPVGMYALPEPLGELHAPLFHFLRTHLERAPLGGEAGSSSSSSSSGSGSGGSGSSEAPARNAVTFAAVVDLWLMLLTPWRGRPRYKNLLPVSMPEGGEGGGGTPGLRAFRVFDYSAAASDLIQERVRSARTGSAAAWAREGRGPTDTEPVDAQDDTVETCVHLPKEELGKSVRGGVEYRVLLGATLDFDPTVSPSGKAKGCLGEAPPPPADLEDPLGVRFPSGLHFSAFSSWVPLHYAFYTHLLAVFLRRLRTAGFPTPSTALSSEAKTRAGGAQPGKPLHCPRHPVLLEALEHVLDVFSLPELRVTLAEVGADVEELFPAPGGGGGAPSASPLPPRPPLSKAVASQLSRRTLLLAHMHLLNLPTAVSPRDVLPPVFALEPLTAAAARAAPPAPPRGAGSEQLGEVAVRGGRTETALLKWDVVAAAAGASRPLPSHRLRCCTGPGQALQHAEDVFAVLGSAAAAFSAPSSTSSSSSLPSSPPFPGIPIPSGTTLLDFARPGTAHSRRSSICFPLDIVLRRLCCDRRWLSCGRRGLGLLWTGLPALPWQALALCMAVLHALQLVFRFIYGHGPFPTLEALLGGWGTTRPSSSSAGRAAAATAAAAAGLLVPRTVASAMPSPTRRVGPNASMGGAPAPMPPGPPPPLSPHAPPPPTIFTALPGLTPTAYTAFKPLPDSSPLAIRRYADRLCLAQDRAGLLLCGRELDSLPAPPHWRVEPPPPVWHVRCRRGCETVWDIVLGMGTMGQKYRRLSQNNEELARQRQRVGGKAGGGSSRGSSRGAAAAAAAAAAGHSAVGPLGSGIVANSWESSLVLNVLVALADAVLGVEGWQEGQWLEWAMRCAADVRLLAAVAALLAVLRDSSLGWKWALGAACTFSIAVRLLFLCWDGTV